MKQVLSIALMALGLSFGLRPAVSGEAGHGHGEAHEGAGGQEHMVKMTFSEETGDVLFEPARLEIKSGDTVTWIQTDEFNEHNVVSYPGGIPMGAELFEGPLLNEIGQKYSLTFSMPGTYRYHCHPHEAQGMRGVIIVDRESLPGEFRKADPSEVHEHGGGMDMKMDMHDGHGKGMDMKMDMHGEHGKAGNDHGHGTSPKASHGHDGAQSAAPAARIFAATGGLEGLGDESLRAFLKNFHRALFNDDRETLVASFAPDAIVFESGVREKSLSGFFEHHLGPELAMLTQRDREVLWENVTVTGDVAFYSVQARTSHRAGDKVVKREGSETMSLERVDGRWLIKVIHWSSRR